MITLQKGSILLAMLIAFSLTTGQDTGAKGNTIKHLNKNKFESKLLKEINEQPIDRLIEKNNQKLQEIKQQEQQQELQQKAIREQRQKPKWVTVRLSYYTSNLTDCNKTDGITASGKHAAYGMCAAPSNFPLGSTFVLQSGQELTVQDRGGAIKVRDGVIWLDVFIPNATEEELNSMGVKYVKAYLK